MALKNDLGILTINGNGGVPVAKIRKYLDSLESAYNGIYVFEALTLRIEEIGKSDDSIFDRFISTLLKSPKNLNNIDPKTTDILFLLSAWPPTEKRLARFVLPEDKLTLRRVNLQSPGDWEFIAKLNPLENIRLFLQDHHERLKDRKYRNTQEERQLTLENDARTIQNRTYELQAKKAEQDLRLSEQVGQLRIVREKFNILKELGASEETLIPLVNELISKPLEKLIESQNEGIISDAKITRALPESNLDLNQH